MRGARALYDQMRCAHAFHDTCDQGVNGLDRGHYIRFGERLLAEEKSGQGGGDQERTDETTHDNPFKHRLTGICVMI